MPTSTAPNVFKKGQFVRYESKNALCVVTNRDTTLGYSVYRVSDIENGECYRAFTMDLDDAQQEGEILLGLGSGDELDMSQEEQGERGMSTFSKGFLLM